MMLTQPLAVLLTVLFVGTGVYCLLRCVVPTRLGASPALAPRISEACHVIMAIGMTLMAWPWGMRAPRWPQLIVFGLGTIFFLAQLVRPDRHSRVAVLQHALMMGAMVWMIVIMPDMMAMGKGGAGSAPMAGMRGMSMRASAAGAQLPAGMAVVTAVAAVCLLLSTFYWTAQAVRLVRVLAETGPAAQPVFIRTPGAQATCHALMALGMTVMLVAMI